MGHLYVCMPLPLFNLQSLARRSSEARTVCRRGGASLADRTCGVTDLDRPQPHWVFPPLDLPHREGAEMFGGCFL